MNNTVYNSTGKVIGFRCTQCGEIFQSMWGCTCNGCREANRKHNEYIRNMQEISATLSKLQLHEQHL